jgi:hypothetical protein
VLCARTALKLEASLGGWGGAEGYSKNDPMEKLYAFGIYPGEEASNSLTVNNPLNDLAKEGPKLCSLELRPYDRSRCAEHGGSCDVAFHGVPAPQGMVMVAPLEIPRHASRAQSEGPRQGG